MEFKAILISYFFMSRIHEGSDYSSINFADLKNKSCMILAVSPAGLQACIR